MSSYEIGKPDRISPLEATAEGEWITIAVPYETSEGCYLAIDFERRTTFKLRKEMDAYSSPKFEDYVARFVTNHSSEWVLVIDCSEVSFLDSSGLRAFLTAERRCREAGGTFRLKDPSDAVERLFDITGIRDMFVIETATEDKA